MHSNKSSNFYVDYLKILTFSSGDLFYFTTVEPKTGKAIFFIFDFHSRLEFCLKHSSYILSIHQLLNNPTFCCWKRVEISRFRRVLFYICPSSCKEVIIQVHAVILYMCRNNTRFYIIFDSTKFIHHDHVFTHLITWYRPCYYSVRKPLWGHGQIDPPTLSRQFLRLKDGSFWPLLTPFNCTGV